MTAKNDEVLVTGPKVTVGFNRKVSVRDYESAEASIFIEVPTEPGDSIDDITAKLVPTFAAAKSTVFQQLGIPFETDPATLVVTELLEKHLGAVEVTAAPEAQAVAAEASAQASVSQARPRQSGGGTPAPTSKQGLWDELASNPKKWFDNRESKKGNQPDFKRKYTGEGLWLENKGKSQVPDGVVVPDASEF